MLRRLIKRILISAFVVVLALVALLAYTFVPRKIDVTAYKADSTSFHPSENTNTLPDVTLSLIECGKMMRSGKLFRDPADMVCIVLDLCQAALLS